MDSEIRSRKIAHISDIHFGKISHPGIVDALLEDINQADVYVVAVSGDLTQRAHDHQFQDAKAMLDRFSAPVLVVPGNHDVRQFWHNPIERVVRSTVRFERWITDNLTPTLSAEGLSVFGMNSAHGLTVKGGLIRRKSLEAMESYFTAQPEEDFKVLVVHHHLIKNPGAFGRSDVSRGATSLIAVAVSVGVDLVLCGHYHIPFVTDHAIPGGGRLTIAAAGTATSSRGRSDHRGVNSYNMITVSDHSFSVEERRFDGDSVEFRAEHSSSFTRS